MGNRTHNTKNHIKIIIIFILFATSCISSKAPDDNSMMDHFRANKAEFEKLVKMVKQETKLEILALDFIIPDNCLKAERIDEYRKIMRKIKIQDIFCSKKKDYLSFTYYAYGLSITGAAKGYAYFENESLISKDSDIVNNLDEYYKAKRKTGKFLTYDAYRRIENNWYLNHEVDD